MSHNSTSASADPFRFEPTVVSAMRRYRVMVIAVAVLVTAAAIGYTLKQPKTYRGEASVTVPQQASSQTQQSNPGQYLDSQVLLLQSQVVARRAAIIANSVLGSHLLATSDFFGPSSTLEVIPPTTTTPGGYGATIVGVSFAWPNARIAQVGTNAVLRAYSGLWPPSGREPNGGGHRSVHQPDRQAASIGRPAAGCRRSQPGCSEPAAAAAAGPAGEPSDATDAGGGQRANHPGATPDGGVGGRA
jgi:hypothetical protein